MLNFKKVSIFSLVIYLMLFIVNSKSKLSQANASSLNICPGFESQKIYAVPTASNKTSCPSNDSKIIYVSTLGNDNNDGLSANNPVETLAKAVELIKRSSPDWIVLKRGETFKDSFGVIKYRKNERALGGKHIDRPFVITSYGESVERPIIQAEENGIDLWGPFKNITISGLEFYSKPGSGGTGIRTLKEGKNYVIHNNYISGFSLAVNLQAKPDKGKWLDTVIVKDNILADSASAGKSHSQGMFALGAKKLTIEGNVIDTCGWYLDRNGELENSRIATIYNHCIYLQNGGYPAKIRNNIITRASSHGLQARSGAFVENNIFARNPIQFFLSSKGLNGKANQNRMSANNNVILEGNDINYDLQRGLGIQHNNAYLAQYNDNIVAHVLAASEHNKKAIEIVCKTNDVHTSISGKCQAQFNRNFVFNWGNELGGNLVSAKNFNHDLFIRHSFKKNTFTAISDGIKFVNFKKEAIQDRYKFNDNTYISNSLTNKKMFSLPEKSRGTFIVWKESIEPKATGIHQFNFTDPCRTMATYYDDFVLGDLKKDNCQIMHDNKLFDQFIELAKQKNAIVAGSGVDVNSFINYVKEGFVVVTP